MKKLSSDEFKSYTLDMLKALAKLCEDNNLRYILDCGTLLGCIRHAGFIPWDDDIDVIMPREDYNRLFEIMEKDPECLGEYYRLAAYNNKYSVQKAYFNIIDTRTITISPNRRKKYYYPVWIDVFPADYLPDDDNQAASLHEECKNLLYKAQLSYHPGYGKLKWIRGLRNSRDLKNLPGYLEKMNSLATSVEASSRLTNYFSIYRMKDILYWSYFDDFIYMEFEKAQFRVPREYDKRLTQLYKDYMQLPPEDKRVSHVANAYLK